MQPLAAFSELIAPTRTLGGEQKLTGLLSVFSEPPDLPVLLDGVDIGKTPVILKEVTSGAHTLRVKGTEKEITVPPGKSLQLSFFKDVLIIIPEKKPQVSYKPRIRRKEEAGNKTGKIQQEQGTGKSALLAHEPPRSYRGLEGSRKDAKVKQR